MKAEKLYNDLADRMNQGLVGTPKTPALMEILKALFPEDEAKIALKLPLYQHKTMSELKKKFPGDPDIEEIIERMRKKGTVFMNQESGKEPVYRLMPSLIGWCETPFWPGKETPLTRTLGPLWVKYLEEAYYEELARSKPVLRVIPISEKLRTSQTVQSYEAVTQIVQNQHFCAVAHCPCRLMKKSVGEGCDHTLENCLHFGSMGKYMVDQGMARKISKKETLAILRKANEEGLVHGSENLNGLNYVNTICNCCGCCCAFVNAEKRGLHAYASSSYIAKVATDLCVGCGICETRCPVGAIRTVKKETALIDEAVCLGCGVCTPTCAKKAIHLVKRDKVEIPPDISELFLARFRVQNPILDSVFGMSKSMTPSLTKYAVKAALKIPAVRKMVDDIYKG